MISVYFSGLHALEFIYLSFVIRKFCVVLNACQASVSLQIAQRSDRIPAPDFEWGHKSVILFHAAIFIDFLGFFFLRVQMTHCTNWIRVFVCPPNTTEISTSVSTKGYCSQKTEVRSSLTYVALKLSGLRSIGARHISSLMSSHQPLAVVFSLVGLIDASLSLSLNL